MEKIHALIIKLQELKQDNASLSTLSYYTQLLYAEIMRVKSENRQQEIRAKINVSVILPASLPEEALDGLVDRLPEISISSNGRIAETIATTTHFPVEHSSVQEVIYSAVTEKQLSAESLLTENPPANPHLNGIVKEIKEINEMEADLPSWNERLREQRLEISEKLSTAKIRDLQDAITLNDKFLFIHDLFRGDRDMYERSIKTINGFPSKKEADYWIERELKIKLGWREEMEMVKSFNQIVNKRFPSI